MLVRKVAEFIQLVIQEIKHVGGQIVLTPASMKCIRVEDTGDSYRCYFEATDGEKTVENQFVSGDQARAQTFNVKEGVNENVKNTYYWRLVTGVGDNYIDLSKTDCDAGARYRPPVTKSSSWETGTTWPDRQPLSFRLMGTMPLISRCTGASTLTNWKARSLSTSHGRMS